MAKKTLNIVDSAYRAVMEEQDDTIFWLLAAMQSAGAEHTVVLRGNAVNYAVKGQDAPALSVGDWKQSEPPRIERDLADLIEKRKMTVFALREDLSERGIEESELSGGIRLLPRAALPGLCEEHALVSLW